MMLVRLAVAVAVLLLPTFAHAADEKPAAPDPRKGPPELAALKYRSIGPAWGGRVSRVAGVPADPTTYYAATASGGVWKSADGGRTWKPIFDDQPVSSIGSIAVAPTDPAIVYVGSGEANIRGNVAAGNGIYKSEDGGRTWRHVWKQEGQIGTMVVHPRDANTAFAAVLGHAFGPNPERGIYRTRDGGTTWQQVLRKDADTGASDVALDPNNPSIVFAGLWQARRRPWEMTSGGPGSGLYVSRDGGDTWTQLTGSGLPAGTWGKVGVAVAPSDSRRVYALIEAAEGGLFRSDDGGLGWKRVSGHRALRQRAWYYSTITVHPANANEVWFPQVPMLRSLDGGATIRPVHGFHHGDHHDLWIDPKNPRRMIDANDGGVEVSEDGGETWRAAHLPIGQFYHVSVDTRVPYRVAGALQDIGTAQGPSDTLASGGIARRDWYSVGGGEAGHVVSKPDDPDIVYAGEYLGYISRYDHRTRQARHVGAWPDNPSGWAGEAMKYRFQWTAPIAASPHDPEVIYHGANVLFRSHDGGQTWATISPDLTRNDRTKQQWSGGPITGDNTGVETYCTIFAVAESPLEKGLIWAGSDDGLVHVTRDAGGSWSNVTAAMRGFPEWGTVSLIEPSRFEPGTAYVVVDAHRLDDMKPYLFKTGDYGRTWTRLDAGLPQDVYLHAVREDPARRGLLYLGTERGVAFSVDGGSTWRPLQLNLPTVAVHDLVVKDRALVLGTHGRSAWILDDLTPVREFDAQVAARDLHVFPVADTVAWQYAHAPAEVASGANPPRGAVVHYFLKGAATGEATLDILDAQGTRVRRLSSQPAPLVGASEFEEFPEEEPKGAVPSAAGIQRAVWDLRHEGAERAKGARIDYGDPSAGPPVLPGVYTLRLSANGKTAETTVRVLPDPRQQVAAADQEAQVRFTLAVRDDLTRLTRLITDLQAVRSQLQARKAVLAATEAMRPLTADIDAAIGELTALEGQVHNPHAEVVYDILAMKGGARLYSRLSPLLMFADGDGPPTQGLRDVHAALQEELTAAIATYERITTGQVAAINARARELGLGFVTVPAR
jgi:photosystem II stability/assembly factor-like uncharacterized protein